MVGKVQFTFCDGFQKGAPKDNITLKTMYNLMTTHSGLERHTISIRSESDRDKRNQLKKELPHVVLSGVYEGARVKDNFKSENVELVQLDFDHVEKIEELKNKLIEIPEVAMVFISPSGDGVKGIIYIEKGCYDYLRIWQNVRDYIFSSTGHNIDPSTKDITRTMFVCFDAECYFNPDAKPLKIMQKLEELPGKSISQKPQDTTQIEYALNYIEADDYMKWIEVGFSLYNSGNGSAEYLNIWDNWSKRSPKYERKAILEKWKSFESSFTGRKRTIASIYKEAKSNGWQRKIESKEPITIEDCDEEKKQKILDFTSKYCFCSKDNRIVNKETLEERHGVGRDALIRTHCGGGRFLDLALTHMDCVYDIVHWWGYEGYLSYENKKLFSTWKPFVPQNKKEHLESGNAIDVLYKFLSMNYDEPELFMKWIAMCVHGEKQRPNWGIAIYGTHGSGKSILFDRLMPTLLGFQNSVKHSTKLADSFHNGEQEGKRLIFFEEMAQGRKADHCNFLNDLKDKVSSDRIIIRKMRTDQYTAPNHAFFAMATNDVSGIPLEEGDGRWLVLETKFQTNERDVYITEQKAILLQLIDVIDNYPNDLFEEMKHVDFSNLPFAAPSTEHRKRVLETKVNYTEETVYEYIHEVIDADCDFFTARSFKDWTIENKRNYYTNDLPKYMKKYGYEYKTKKIDKKDTRIWKKVDKFFEKVKELKLPKKELFAA